LKREGIKNDLINSSGSFQNYQAQAIIEAALGMDPVDGITKTWCYPGYIMTG
jgi:hypothetical protein